MTTHAIITRILAEILDLHEDLIQPETYLIRDLGAESIDLLEIGVAMQHRLHIPVDDDTLFLKNVRTVLARARQQGLEPRAAMAATYPHLDPLRHIQILDDLDGGPVLLVADLLAYAESAARNCGT
jgi:acyl carrier protein